MIFLRREISTIDWMIDVCISTLFRFVPSKLLDLGITGEQIWRILPS